MSQNIRSLPILINFFIILKADSTRYVFVIYARRRKEKKEIKQVTSDISCNINRCGLIDRFRLMATSKLLALACIRNESSSYRDLLTSTLKYPKVVSGPVKSCSRAILLSVKGMTCSACAVSIEKAIKRLPGIHDAVVDVLNNRAQVLGRHPPQDTS